MPNRPRPAGFSLIELITVVMILGIVAGVAVPKMMGQSDEAAIEATISHLKTIALACEMHCNETGVWPDDETIGVMPATLSTFLRPNLFAKTPPIGGGYDWDNNTSIADLAIKVSDFDPDLDVWRSIDARIDDGIDNTGNVRIVDTAGRTHLCWLLSE